MWTKSDAIKKIIPIQLRNIIRFGDIEEEIENTIPKQFESLILGSNDDDSCDLYSEQIQRIIEKSENRLIELIIIPNRYFSDPEVLQTVQVRDVAHERKNGIGVVMTALAANTLIGLNIFPDTIWRKVYKISTIRHGFATEKEDENAPLLVELAKICVEKKATFFCEIVIRACESAGYLNQGLADRTTLKPLGLSSEPELDEITAKQARSFLHGKIGIPGTSEYKKLKQLTLRTQTMAIQHAVLTDSGDPKCMNVAYHLRSTLDNIHLLRHISVKAYYDTVNPVPEDNPTRMGRWEVRRREAGLFFPKAVRLISPDYKDFQEEKPNHLTRSV